MPKQYDTFVRDFKSLPSGKMVQITIRDLTPGIRKYNAQIVRAVVSAEPDKMPQGDVLWLRSATGVLSPKPWAIQVKEEIKGFIKAPPYSSLPAD